MMMLLWFLKCFKEEVTFSLLKNDDVLFARTEYYENIPLNNFRF